MGQHKKNRSQQSGSSTGQEERLDKLTFDGVVEEAMPGTLFRIRCDSGHLVTATLSGKMRLNHIKILPGDACRVEVSAYDPSKGRIIWRK